MVTKEKTRFTVTIPKDLYAELEKEAVKQRRSKSCLINILIEEALLNGKTEKTGETI